MKKRRAVCSVFGLDRNFSSRLVSNPVVSSTLDCNYGRRLEGATAYAPFVNAVHKRLSSQSTKASAPPPDVPATTPDRSPDATREATDIKSTPTSPPRRKPHVDHPHPYPPPYRRLPVHLKSRTGGLVSFAPTTTHVPIDTSFPDLINPDGTRVVNRSTHRFRPPYLPDRIAKTINIRSDDLYILSRSIELFGSPGVSDWVSELRERICPTVVAGWVNYMLSRLPWNHIQVRALKDAAWAEHLEAMQSPSLKGGSDDWEAHPENEVSAPTWPSDPDAGPNLGLSWSTSGERDQPRYALPPPVIHGPRNFPRPKRIARAQPWDTHLVVVFATSTARRAVLAAYSAWVRKQLVEAHKTNQIPKGNPVLPPVSRADLGEIKVGQREKEAMHWAERVGWRPEYRMRACPGERARGKAGTGDGWYESTRLRQQRLTQEALRREKSE